jgi:hypothetical protein
MPSTPLRPVGNLRLDAARDEFAVKFLWPVLDAVEKEVRSAASITAVDRAYGDALFAGKHVVTNKRRAVHNDTFGALGASRAWAWRWKVGIEGGT